MSHPVDEEKSGLKLVYQEERLISRKQLWAETRFRMEMDNLKTRRYGDKGRHHWFQMLALFRLFKLFLHATGFYAKGLRNAENIVLREQALFFKHLPPAFEGFRILHLSDLHLDGMEGQNGKGIEDRVLALVEDQHFDLCVFTGDYRSNLHGPHKRVIKGMARLAAGISSSHGCIGVLGNHDGCHMLTPLEKAGITMLVNASVLIQKGEERIRIIGTDDVHYYFTDQALHALEHAEDDFTIALVHSPELFDYAAMLGVDLYLCGHTHGGQVCLPGGRAIFKHLNRGHRFYKGHWRFENMQGFTSAGIGTSGLPVRFHSQGEVLVYTLHRSESLLSKDS